MKQFIFLLLFTFYFLLSTLNCFSQRFGKQSFKKGTITAGTGVGFGVYYLTTNDDIDTAHAVAPVLIPISIEYGISNTISVGLMFERNGFFIAKKDSGSARSINIGVKGEYHFGNIESSTFLVDLVIGYSSIKFIDKTVQGKANNTKVTGTGITYQLSFGFKTYFSRKAGWFINLGYAGYLYGKLIDNKNPNSPDAKTSTGDLLVVNMNGVNLRTGIVIKLL